MSEHSDHSDHSDRSEHSDQAKGLNSDDFGKLKQITLGLMDIAGEIVDLNNKLVTYHNRLVALAAKMARHRKIIDDVNILNGYERQMKEKNKG